MALGKEITLKIVSCIPLPSSGLHDCFAAPPDLIPHASEIFGGSFQQFPLKIIQHRTAVGAKHPQHPCGLDYLITQIQSVQLSTQALSQECQRCVYSLLLTLCVVKQNKLTSPKQQHNAHLPGGAERIKICKTAESLHLAKHQPDSFCPICIPSGHFEQRCSLLQGSFHNAGKPFSVLANLDGQPAQQRDGGCSKRVPQPRKSCCSLLQKRSGIVYGSREIPIPW